MKFFAVAVAIACACVAVARADCALEGDCDSCQTCVKLGGSFCEWKVKKPQGNSFAITKGPYCYDPASNGAVCEVSMVYKASSCPKVVVDVVEPSDSDKNDDVVVVVEKEDDEDDDMNSTEIADLEERVDELMDFIHDLASPLPQLFLSTMDDCEAEIEEYCPEQGSYARSRLERAFPPPEDDEDDDDDDDDEEEEDKHRGSGRKLLHYHGHHHGGFRHGGKGKGAPFIMCMKRNFDKFSKKCQQSILYATKVKNTKKKICMPPPNMWHNMHHGWGMHHFPWALIAIGLIIKII